MYVFYSGVGVDVLHKPVTHAKHVLLSQGYVADERFRAHYENLQPGLAEWLKDAIATNARAHGVDPENVEWA